MTEDDLLGVVHKIDFLPSDDAEVTLFIPFFRLYPFGAGVPKIHDAKKRCREQDVYGTGPSGIRLLM